ncbi:MAG TPA: PspC domain-containing protein [Candidatus Thermoplasmatota archaeon]|nr:PspC domain-containing protein [Candidatus Thermoplasmatota archaeon]
MKECPSCHQKNPNAASFCQHCGAKLSSSSSKSQFEQNMDHFGEEVEHIGKKIETSFEKTGKQIETWYDKTFGVMGPVLSALIAFVIFFIAINILSFFGQTRPWMQEISMFLESLLIVFLIIFFLSSYTHYFSKKIKPFRFVSPLIGAIVFMVWFWVAINILAIIANQFDLVLVQTFIDFFEALIFPLAVLILLIGYIGVITSSKQESHSQQSRNDTANRESGTEKRGEQEGYNRLYRSGKDRILGGVLGGLAEYLNVDPTIIRVLYVLLFFASVGFIVLAYFVGWIIIPRNPAHHW